MNQEIEAVTSAKKTQFVTAQHNDNAELQCPEWERLPYPALVEVFRHLCDSDRVKMSQVCIKFKNVFRDPSLWRKRKFIIDGRTDIKHINFTSEFGSYLENVFIEVWHGKSTKTRKNSSQSLVTLLENIKSARLRNLDMRFLELSHFMKLPERMDSINCCFKEMFQTQNGLKIINLSRCQISQSTGTEVLETLATSTGHGLRQINLTDYLHKILNVYDLEKFRETLKNFSNLTYIAVNYSYISDEVLRHWAVSLRQKLESIDITAHDTEPHTHTISNGTWRELCASCPKLNVRIDTNFFSLANEVTHLLQPAVPLYHYVMVASMRNVEKYIQLSLILKHLVTCFKDTLEIVIFSFGEMDYTPDNDLVHLIEQCHQLKIFHYLGNCGIAVPNAIGDRLKDSKSVLHEVNILRCRAEFDPTLENKINLIHVILDYYNHYETDEDDDDE